MSDALRVTLASVLLLMALGILSQVGNFLSVILHIPELAKWVDVFVVISSALIISWWMLEV